VTTGGNWNLCALRHERGHRVVTGSVVGGAGWLGRTVKAVGPLIGGPDPVKISFQISNSSWICKFKMEAFPCFKNIEILHWAIFEYYEKLSQFG
jgi:hypothetical protein